MKALSGRPKKCKGCGQKFVPERTFQIACSIRCAQDVAAKARSKENSKAARVARDKLKTRSEWLTEAQKAFNAWVRERDYGQGCISCGRSTGCKVNAGHYRSVGAMPALRFHPDNVHLQCEHCNTYLSSNAVEYRIRLVQKIGAERVEWLEGEHEPLKLTVDQIKEIKTTYSKMARELKKARESNYS